MIHARPRLRRPGSIAGAPRRAPPIWVIDGEQADEVEAQQPGVPRGRERRDREPDATKRGRDERHRVQRSNRTEAAPVHQTRDERQVGARLREGLERTPRTTRRIGRDPVVGEVELDDAIAPANLCSVCECHRPAPMPTNLDHECGRAREWADVMPRQIPALPPQPHLQRAGRVPVSTLPARDQPPEERGRGRTPARRIPKGTRQETAFPGVRRNARRYSRSNAKAIPRPTSAMSTSLMTR